MNPPEELQDLFEAEGPDASLSSADHHQQKFDRLSKTLRSGNAWGLDRTPEVLAFEALEELEKCLRLGQPTPSTLYLLADFLRDVLDRSERSAPAYEEESRLSFRILGHRPNGRPDSNHARSRMLAVYEMWIGEGATQHEAERRAFDAYQEASGRADSTFERESKKKVTITKGAKEKESNRAEQLLESTLRPALREAGLIPTKKPKPTP